MKNPENHPDNYKQNKLWKIKLSDSFHKWKCERIKLSNQMNEKKILYLITDIKKVVYITINAAQMVVSAHYLIFDKEEKDSLQFYN